MKLPRRNFLHLAAGAAALPAVSRIARAQAYPSRPVRIIVAFAAGGTIDTLGRLVAQMLSEGWGQSVVVENRPGASGNIGALAAAQSLPDGNIQAGKMGALAVSGRARAAQLPDVATFNELGVAFVDESSWYALFAPRGTPKEIIAKINADMTRILALPDMKERETTLGYRFV